MFISTTNGGVFVTQDGGATWKALTDKQSSLSIASLGLDPTDPSGRTIIAGMGITANGAWGSSAHFLEGRGGPRNRLLYSTDGRSSRGQIGTGGQPTQRGRGGGPRG